jgi:hypothetical protein
MLLGHGHPEVMEAVLEQLPKGMTFFANNAARHRTGRGHLSTPCPAPSRCAMSPPAARPTCTRSGWPAPSPARQDPEVRGRLSRHVGGGADEPRARPAGEFPTAVPDSAGIPQGVRDEMLIAPFNDLTSSARSCGTCRHRSPRSSSSRCSGSSRRARFLQALRDRMRQARHRADLRRDRHRLPLRLWRRAGALRRHAGHLHAGQDHRRRLSAGRIAGPGRHHGAFRQGQGGRGRG